MNKSIYEQLKEHIQNIEKKQEIVSHEDIRFHLLPKILEILGYTEDGISIRNEKTQFKDRIDMCLSINRKSCLIIEIKKCNEKVNLMDLETLRQITSYMHYEAVKWGIITDGSRFILINTRIDYENSIEEQIVLDVDLKCKGNGGKKEYIKYFSKESIFDSKKTDYFKEIAQYKAYIKPKLETWKRYEGTLYNFFDYLSINKSEFISLDNIKNNLIDEYIKNGKKRSTKTIRNIQTHIHGFLEEHRKRGKIVKNNFIIDVGIMNKYDNDKKEKGIPFVLSKESVGNIWDELQKKDDKYKLFYLLNIGTARTRREIWGLKWKDIKINKSNVKIRFGKSIITFEGKIQELVERLYPKREKELKEFPYVFNGIYKKSKRHLKDNNATEVYNDIKKTLGYERFSIEEVNAQLILLMFYSNYSIEEIVYITGKNLKNLSKYINEEDIVTRITKSNNKTIQRTRQLDIFPEMLKLVI